MTKATHIIADIGGTNVRFACLSTEAEDSWLNTLHGIQIYSCRDFPTVLDAIRAYLSKVTVAEHFNLCLAVPGPVDFDQITLPNSQWSFSRHELADALKAQVTIINDFSAQLLGIDWLEEKDFQWLGSNRPQGNQVKAIIGPGTGLGVAAMLPSGEILPSEGGHLAFAPTNEHEVKLLQLLWKRYERVSVERILSGEGLSNLYWANSVIAKNERELSPEEISIGAHEGKKDCLNTLTDFTSILASVAGELAIAMGALDGVYLSGGILPKIATFLDYPLMRQRFDDKGRFSQYCSDIPLAIILAEQPGLTGCARALSLLNKPN